MVADGGIAAVARPAEKLLASMWIARTQTMTSRASYPILFRVSSADRLWPIGSHGRYTVDGSAAAPDDAPRAPRTWWDRLNNISGTALNDFVDIMAFLVIGATLAAVGKGLLRDALDDTGPQGALARAVQEPALAILIMMGLAIAFCL